MSETPRVGHTPNVGYPYALGSDALTDWPTASQELAEMLDTATLLGSPAIRLNTTAAQVIPPSQNLGMGNLMGEAFMQGGLTNFGGGGVYIGRAGLYFAVTEATWDVYPPGFRGLTLQNWGGAVLGNTATAASENSYTTHQTSGVMYLGAGDVIASVLAQNTDRGITVHSGWLFVVQIAVLLPVLADRLETSGPLPPDPQVIADYAELFGV